MENETAGIQLSNADIQKDLAQLKDIEQVITSQLNELGEKIDSSFSKAAEVVTNITDAACAIGGGVLSSKAKKNIQMAGTLASSAIKGVGNAYNAYKYNKALDALLVQKQEIARTKKGAIEKIMPKIDHISEKYYKVLNNFISRDYDLSKVHEKSYAKFLYNNIDKALSLVRTVTYDSEIAKFILADYDAWLRGEQQSNRDLPTTWTVNKQLKKLLGDPDAMSIFKEYQSAEGTISGKTLCFLHDETFMSMSISDNIKGIFNRGKEGPKNSGEENAEAISWFVDSNKDLLPSPTFLDDLRDNTERYHELDVKTSKIGKIFNVLSIVMLLVIFLWVRNTEWATWAKWVLGIIISFVALIILNLPIASIFDSAANKEMYELYNGTYRIYRDMVGYVYSYRKRLEKKDVVGSFMNSI